MITHTRRFLAPLTLTLTLAVAVVPWLAAPAHAQRAAIVQSVDEPGRNPYQESIANTNCRTTQFCNFAFATVPAGKRLVLTNISGYVDTGVGTFPNGIVQSSLGGSAYATLHFTGTRGSQAGSLGFRMYINEQVLAYFGPGESISGFYGLSSTTDTFSGGSRLTLTGYYINLP
jgi:hypothetical protein